MTESRSIELDIEGLEDPVEIGVGGFATVYKAYQPTFRRTVAVKVLATLNLDDAARERFERECQAMGSLSEHPNIVTVYGAGFNDNGRPYLVMAFLPGGSLQDRIDREGSVSWQDASMYGVHLAGALETAHRAQIVHRDIKPGNVLMSAYGDAQLTDFGIARISGGHETRSGVITASMAHAPPEVLDGNRPTISADVYSLGSTIYELMSGGPAFASEEDESMVPMLRRILTEPPPDLRPRGIPDQICRVIERSMAKDPAQRQTSALQFGRELQQARRELGIEPGKLTVPSDVSVDVAEGEEINFVSAPLTGQYTGPIESIGAATGTYPTPATTESATPPAPAPAAAVSTTGPVYATTGPVYATTAATTGNYAVAPAVEAPKKNRTGLFVGLGVLIVLALAAVAAAAIVGSQQTATTATTFPASVTTPTIGGASSSTTQAVATSTTEGTVVVGYTAETEANFVDACIKNNSRLFCRCVFKEIKDKISFERYLELEGIIGNNGDITKTEVQPIIDDCSKKNPPTPTPSPTPSTK